MSRFVALLLFLRDTPGSMGLPPVEIYKGQETAEELANELKPRLPLLGILGNHPAEYTGQVPRGIVHMTQAALIPQWRERPHDGHAILWVGPPGVHGPD